MGPCPLQHQRFSAARHLNNCALHKGAFISPRTSTTRRKSKPLPDHQVHRDSGLYLCPNRVIAADTLNLRPHSNLTTTGLNAVRQLAPVSHDLQHPPGGPATISTSPPRTQAANSASRVYQSLCFNARNIMALTIGINM